MRVSVDERKEAARRRVLDRLDHAGVVIRGSAHGKIPNFVGADRAADLLAELDVWRRSPEQAASSRTAATNAQLAGVADVEPIDLIACGSVAVDAAEPGSAKAPATPTSRLRCWPKQG